MANHYNVQVTVEVMVTDKSPEHAKDQAANKVKWAVERCSRLGWVSVIRTEIIHVTAE